MNMQSLTDTLAALSGPTLAETGRTVTPTDLKSEQAAKDFEAVLLHKMLQSMANTVPDSPLLDEGAGKQVQDMFWYHLSQDLANKGGLGLWKQIASQTYAAGAEQGKKVNP
jgi:Rod binding domain-containing protein